MLGGLYVLAGTFREERGDIARLVPVWTVLLAYELIVIGMIAVLHRRGLNTDALTAVSLFFLMDVLFVGDAFAASDLRNGLCINFGAWGLALCEAWALARARDVKLSPWLAGWGAAALGFMTLYPSLIAFPASRPADFSHAYWIGVWVASALVVPLARGRIVGWALAAGVMVHLAASGIVASAAIEPRFFTPPLIAATIILPWRNWRWIPLTGALLTSPLRPVLQESITTVDGIGVLLVAGAFGLLATGFLQAYRRGRLFVQAEHDRRLADRDQVPVGERPGGDG
jgi:hypothetical protein